MGISRKEIKPQRLTDTEKIAKESPIHDIEKVEQPERKPKDDDMWNKIKTTLLERLLPTLRDQIDIDIDVRKKGGTGVVQASVTVTALGRVILMRKKTFKL